MPMTGTDVDNALNEYLDENGVSDLEFDDSETNAIQRWQFPRYLPKCRMSMGEPGEGNLCGEQMELNKKGDSVSCPKHKKYKLPMDPADMYLSRTGIGKHDSDVETLVAWMNAPRNIVGLILLLSDPGTGKTMLIESAVTHAERELMTVLCTPDHTKDSLFLRFVGEDHGDFLPNGQRSPYTLGPIPYAAKHGLVLYLDEGLMLEDGVKPLIYSLSDGRPYLPEGNVDGSPLEIHKDFRLVMSANPIVRGASLPEPLASRAASTTLTIETSEDMLRDLDIDESIVAAWVALGQQNLWRPQIRELRLAHHWLPIDATQAVSAFIPEHCPESQRNAVRDIVVGFLGTSSIMRHDGRLVVQ